MKMPITRYEPFTLVYMRADMEVTGTITGYIVRANCPIQYLVMWSEDRVEVAHWEGELTEEKQYGAGGDET